LLEVNDVQEGIITVAFALAKRFDAEIASLADLSALLRHMVEKRKELASVYGGVSPASVATIQRKVMALESQGGAQFFGYPNFDIHDFICTSERRGVVNVLMADRLYLQPRMYSTFLFWMLSQLFERLPEIGDTVKPRMVFFFDEAHLLFKDASKPLLERIDQTVRLIRSKGVGIYFITQSPTDIPNDILRQLNNRFQHAIRAYSPQDQKLVRAASASYRPNPQFDTAQVMQSLEVGDALVSCLDESGMPNPVQITRIKTPHTRLGPLTEDERRWIVNG